MRLKAKRNKNEEVKKEEVKKEIDSLHKELNELNDQYKNTTNVYYDDLIEQGNIKDITNETEDESQMKIVMNEFSKHKDKLSFLETKYTIYNDQMYHLAPTDKKKEEEIVNDLNQIKYEIETEKENVDLLVHHIDFCKNIN